MKIKKDGVFVEVGGSGLPEGAAPGLTIIADENSQPTWGATASAPALFRGSWSAGEVAFYEGFTDGIPSNWTCPLKPFNAQFRTGLPSMYEEPAGILNAIEMYTQYSGDFTVLGDLAAYDIDGVIGVNMWWASWRPDPSTLGRQIRSDATVAASSLNDFEWTKVFVPATSSSVLSVRMVAPERGESTIWFSGIEILTSAQPYMRGEFVTSGGSMWESMIDNNGTVPGAAGAAWERAIVLPPNSGTTAQRPDAVVAGEGFPYYDTTLSKPIWSNGTGWTDATGTAL